MSTIQKRNEVFEGDRVRGVSNGVKKLLISFGLAVLLIPVLASAQDTGTAASIYCPNLTVNLQFGSRDSRTGGQVTELQKFLADYYDLNPDDTVTGYFGRITRTNVQKFQCEQLGVCSGNEATTGWGVVGPRTRAKIAEKCGGEGTISQNFTATPRSGVAPLSTSFHFPLPLAESADPYTVDFGDGTTGNMSRNGLGCTQDGAGGCGGQIAQIFALHTYTEPGTYVARLMYQPPFTCNPLPGTACAQVMPQQQVVGTLTITVLQSGGGASVTLSALPRSGTAPLNVALSADLSPLQGQTSGGDVKIEYGDGQSGIICRPGFNGVSGCAEWIGSHTYTYAGVFAAKIVQDSGSCAGRCVRGEVTVTVTAPGLTCEHPNPPDGCSWQHGSGATCADDTLVCEADTIPNRIEPKLSTIGPAPATFSFNLIQNENRLLEETFYINYGDGSSPTLFPRSCYDTRTTMHPIGDVWNYCPRPIITPGSHMYQNPGNYNITITKGENAVVATAKVTVTSQLACTQEAMQCPDGSYVGRTGPNCSFAPCPTTNNASCTLDGVTVAHGAIRKFYLQRTAANNSQCQTYSIDRKCENGVLSGSTAYQYASCTAQATSQPSITITAPPSGTSVAQGSNLTISWTSTNAPAGSYVKVLMQISGSGYSQIVPHGNPSGSFDQPIFSIFSTGARTITAYLYDANGNLLSNQSTTINVTAPSKTATVGACTYKGQTYSEGSRVDVPRIVPPNSTFQVLCDNGAWVYPSGTTYPGQNVCDDQNIQSPDSARNDLGCSARAAKSLLAVTPRHGNIAFSVTVITNSPKILGSTATCTPYTLSWGDGNTETYPERQCGLYEQDVRTHTYSSAGTYTVSQPPTVYGQYTLSNSANIRVDGTAASAGNQSQLANALSALEAALQSILKLLAQ